MKINQNEYHSCLASIPRQEDEAGKKHLRYCARKYKENESISNRDYSIMMYYWVQALAEINFTKLNQSKKEVK